MRRERHEDVAGRDPVVVHWCVPSGRVYYADSAGIDIAYRQYGDGDRALVLVPGMLAHLDLNEEIPYYRPLVERLPRIGRLTVFDKRGSGLSGRAGLVGPEEQVDDLRAVPDAAAIDKATLIGAADGGPIAMLFAAAYPDRVEALVLYQTWSRLVRDDAYPIGVPLDNLEAVAQMYEQAWGTGRILRGVIDDLPDDKLVFRLLAQWERSIGSPRDQARRWRLLRETDVRSALPLIACPTLVAYRRGRDTFGIFGQRACIFVGEQIAHARCVELPADSTIMSWSGREGELLCDAIEAFIAEPAQSAPPATRMLATVLFTDVVASTATARQAGDAWWVTMLKQLHDTASVVTRRLGGRVVKSTGDGTLAVFDAPGRAVSAALQMCDQARRIGLSLRAGIHVGEIEVADDDIGGVAVALAARIVEQARPNEVVVSRTVNDLTVGSLIRYESRGPVDLKGFDQPWELFTVTAS